jgi:hypothetical protein
MAAPEASKFLESAVKMRFMVNLCHTSTHAQLESGVAGMPWLPGCAFVDSIQSRFKYVSRSALSFPESDHYLEIKEALKGWKLQRRLGIRFRPTNDLSRHLKFHRKEGYLEIFHHAAFLKEHLRVMRGLPRDTGWNESLKRLVIVQQPLGTTF